MPHRPTWKGPWFVPLPPARPGEAVMTNARACTIIPPFVGRRILVHNGNKYIAVDITEQMVGHKLGEFAMTRKKFTFKKEEPKKR
ncbi:hypothetical protein BJ742DRAFT_674675 [Cladochytrium replicatum]|nr:hypothetical protein BJ742DRAFT_674675 [Cladochytrium replicatum]